ncbi:hypothetical protein FIU94_13820 [Sulfitobacter sp. THAF37]|nr:hypothetical protein FIU94_13820 [Sulfitobacter sp. THAF37]
MSLACAIIGTAPRNGPDFSRRVAPGRVVRAAHGQRIQHRPFPIPSIREIANRQMNPDERKAESDDGDS